MQWFIVWTSDLFINEVNLWWLQFVCLIYSLPWRVSNIQGMVIGMCLVLVVCFSLRVCTLLIEHQNMCFILHIECKCINTCLEYSIRPTIIIICFRPSVFVLTKWYSKMDISSACYYVLVKSGNRKYEWLAGTSIHRNNIAMNLTQNFLLRALWSVHVFGPCIEVSNQWLQCASSCPYLLVLKITFCRYIVIRANYCLIKTFKIKVSNDLR